MAKDPYKYFRIEANDLTDQLGRSLLELERDGSGGEIVPRLLRLAHTLKGAARVVRQPEIADHAHNIEALLIPLRDGAMPVSRESIEGLLVLLDSIVTRLTTLALPETVASDAVATETAMPAEESFRLVRSDREEIDEVLNGVTEANAQLRALRNVGELATRARRLAEQLAEQLANPGSSGGMLVMAEQLHVLSASIERDIATGSERVDRQLRQVRDVAAQLQLVRAEALFASFERAARDVAQALGKEISFSGMGGDIRLDAHTAYIAQDAIIQLVRNAVAHGIETRRDRVALGKSPLGRVAIAILRRGGQIVFRCEDDGGGIDVAALREAAIVKGRPAAELDRLEADDLVLALLKGGISTSASLSEVAGRGIGMDIVREAVEKLRAELAVTTSVGKGTRFELAVPFSVSSIEALVVEAGGRSASLPIHSIRQTLRLDPSDIHRTSRGEMVRYGGLSIPLLPLGQVLGRASQPAGRGHLTVVVAAEGRFIAVGVTRLVGTATLVFRALPDLAPAISAIAGVSLDADGYPVLMLDPNGLFAALDLAEAGVQAVTIRPPILVIDDSLTTRMLEQSILESAGYEVDVATSGEEGLERARRRDYALILCDVEMPGMDGFGFIETIRRDARLRNVPAILVTSRNSPEDRRRGRDIGAQDYVVKSDFDQAKLLDRIRALVA